MFKFIALEYVISSIMLVFFKYATSINDWADPDDVAHSNQSFK